MDGITDKELKDGMEYGRALATRFAARVRWGEVDDLVAEAYYAVAVASQKYDRSREVKFTTYARFWIMQRLHRYGQKLAKIAAHEGPSLDQFITSDDDFRPDTALSELMLPPELFPEGAVIDAVYLQAAWEGLPRMEREVLYCRFWLGMNYREIGEAFDRSYTWAQNHEHYGLRLLRRELKGTEGCLSR